jgi:hypothetical protein
VRTNLSTPVPVYPGSYASHQFSLTSMWTAFLRLNLLAILGTIIATASPCAAQTFTPLVTATVGSGNNESYFVLNFDDGPNGADNPGSDYVFGYLWSSSNPAPTGNDIILDLSSVGVSVQETYDSEFDEYEVTGFSYASETQNGGYNPVTGNYWAYYQSNGTALAQNPNNWDYAETGPDGETLTNDSYDGWIYSGENTPVTPEVSPAPESATWIGMLVAMAVILGCVTSSILRRRRLLANSG